MEEKTTTMPLNSAEKKPEAVEQINPAQLQAVLRQAEARMQQMMENIKQLDQMLRDKTLDQLFEVLKYSVHFDAEFVEKSAKCIETYLTNIAFSDTKEPVTEEVKEEA